VSARFGVDVASPSKAAAVYADVQIIGAQRLRRLATEPPAEPNSEAEFTRRRWRTGFVNRLRSFGLGGGSSSICPKADREGCTPSANAMGIGTVSIP
jgi:hypothetical protein